MTYRLNKNPLIRILTFSILIILYSFLIIPISISCSESTASNTFIELLSMVPVDFIPTEECSPHELTTLVDYASLYRDTGITFTSFEEWLEKVIEDEVVSQAICGSYITGYGSYMENSTIKKEYVGYDHTCVDAEIQFGVFPSNGVIAIGRFDPNATENALRNQDEWPSWAVDSYAIEEYNGVTIHSWGEGIETRMQTRLCPPHVDNLGRATPLAVTGNHLFNAVSLETIKLIIDTSQNQYKSLADLPEYAAIANGLADLKAYTAVIADEALANRCLFIYGGFSLTLSESEMEIARNNIGTPLKNFLTFGSGIGRDEKGIFTAIVLYHESSDNALANVSLLKQRIEDAKSIHNKSWNSVITDTDIKTEGNVLLAKLYTSYAGLWMQWIIADDNLLFHEME